MRRRQVITRRPTLVGLDLANTRPGPTVGSARHGLRWFEVDFTYYTIKVLAWLRLARDIKLPTPAMIARLSLKTPEKASA